MIREEIREHCSIHFYATLEVGDIFYLIIKYKSEPSGMPGVKAGDIKILYVWVSNDDNSYYKEEGYPFFEYHTDEEIEELLPIKQTEPLLVGKYYGHDFYFANELMTGTPTDETQSIDFIDCLIDFRDIANNVFGVPRWDNGPKKVREY